MPSDHFKISKGHRGAGLPKFQYLGGTGPHAGKDDVALVEHHNYPSWAAGNESLYWTVSDQLTRKNGKVFSGIEGALPRELPEHEQERLVREFLQGLMGKRHVYTFAIHRPLASDGLPNPHMHSMFDERVIDEINREASLWFRRYNPSTPERGGGQIDPSWNNRDCVQLLRQRWEKTCNRILSENGLPPRMDLRSRIVKGEMGPKEPKIGQGIDSAERVQIVEKIRAERVEAEIENNMIAIYQASPRVGEIVIREDALDKNAHIKRCILENVIGAAVKDEFAQQLWFVRKRDVGAWIGFKDPPGGVLDVGERLSAYNMQPRVAASRLIELASFKGWTRVEIVGSGPFAGEAIRLAIQRGIEVVPQNDEQRGIIDAIQKMGKMAIAATKRAVIENAVIDAELALQELERRNKADSRLDALTVEIKDDKDALYIAARELGGASYVNAERNAVRARQALKQAEDALKGAAPGILGSINRYRLNKIFAERAHENQLAAALLSRERKKIDSKAFDTKVDEIRRGNERLKERKIAYAAEKKRLEAALVAAKEEKAISDELLIDMLPLDEAEERERVPSRKTPSLR